MRKYNKYCPSCKTLQESIYVECNECRVTLISNTFFHLRRLAKWLVILCIFLMSSVYYFKFQNIELEYTAIRDHLWKVFESSPLSALVNKKSIKNKGKVEQLHEKHKKPKVIFVFLNKNSKNTGEFFLNAKNKVIAQLRDVGRGEKWKTYRERFNSYINLGQFQKDVFYGFARFKNNEVTLSLEDSLLISNSSHSSLHKGHLISKIGRKIPEIYANIDADIIYELINVSMKIVASSLDSYKIFISAKVRVINPQKMELIRENQIADFEVKTSTTHELNLIFSQDKFISFIVQQGVFQLFINLTK